MNQKKRIDLFLNQIQLLSQNCNISSRQIYAQLISNGIPKEDKFKKLSTKFNTLISINKNNKKTKVFVSPDWKYFCQFKSKKAYEILEMNPIKIYIPLKEENIVENVQKIFNFIEKNNIKHLSKLSSEVRVDSLVIRVGDPCDADKIVNFVNSDRELVDSTYYVNPFCINDGKVGLAMDRTLSYNFTLSEYIHEYVLESNLKKIYVSCDGFLEFLQKKLNLLHTREGAFSAFNKSDNKNGCDLFEFLQATEEITNVIIGVLKGGDKKLLYQYFYNFNDRNYNLNKIREYDKLVNSFESVHSVSSRIDTGQVEDEKLFKELVSVMYNRYGEKGIDALENYARTLKANSITRANNLRDRVLQSKTFAYYIRNIDISSEVEKIFPNKEVILENACKESYMAFQVPERNYSGRRQVAYLLKRIQDNDYSSITRKNNARQLVESNIQPYEVLGLIEKTLIKNGYELNSDIYKLYSSYVEYKCMQDVQNKHNRL